MEVQLKLLLARADVAALRCRTIRGEQASFAKAQQHLFDTPTFFVTLVVEPEKCKPGTE